MDAKEQLEFSRALTLEAPEQNRIFANLWTSFYPRLKVYLRSFSFLSDADREELASDALMRAFKNSFSYDHRKAFEPWLYTITRRLALDYLAGKKNKQENPWDSASIEKKNDPRYLSPEGALMRNEEQSFIGRFIEGLNSTEREIAFLVYAEDLKLSDVARVSGEPLGTVKWRVSEIKKALKSAWSNEYD